MAMVKRSFANLAVKHLDGSIEYFDGDGRTARLSVPGRLPVESRDEVKQLVDAARRPERDGRAVS